MEICKPMMQLQPLLFNFRLREEYFNQKRNLALAQRIENKNQIKFIEGISSSFDLKEAQSQLYNSQQNYLLSMFNIISTKAKLESLTFENNKN